VNTDEHGFLLPRLSRRSLTKAEEKAGNAKGLLVAPERAKAETAH
jgi:hypothetical protein